MGERCKTKYPVLLIHGAGCRDDGCKTNWGAIPSALRREGASVFFSGQDALCAVDRGARQLRRAMVRALRISGAKKLNLIAHSLGGLEARYAVSCLGMGPYTASLTTLSTPHHGARSADRLCRLPNALFQTVCPGVNSLFWLMGDRCPDLEGVARGLCTEALQHFNETVKDRADVFYQSFGAVLRSPQKDPILFLPWAGLRRWDGANDGVIPLSSMEWGEYRGTLGERTAGGISHAHIVDCRPFRDPDFDAPAFYIRLVEELKNRGF